MRKFVFKLSGLLRHREHCEKQRQRALADAHLQIRAQEEELADVNRLIQQGGQDMRTTYLKSPLDLALLGEHQRYADLMRRKSVELARKIAALAEQLETARHALAEASKQRRIIEKLRENQRAEWIAEMNRRELAELDDLKIGSAAQPAAVALDKPSSRQEDA